MSGIFHTPKSTDPLPRIDREQRRNPPPRSRGPPLALAIGRACCDLHKKRIREFRSPGRRRSADELAWPRRRFAVSRRVVFPRPDGAIDLNISVLGPCAFFQAASLAPKLGLSTTRSTISADVAESHCPGRTCRACCAHDGARARVRITIFFLQHVRSAKPRSKHWARSPLR